MLCKHACKSFTERKRKTVGTEDSCVYTGGCVCPVNPCLPPEMENVDIYCHTLTQPWHFYNFLSNHIDATCPTTVAVCTCWNLSIIILGILPLIEKIVLTDIFQVILKRTGLLFRRQKFGVIIFSTDNSLFISKAQTLLTSNIPHRRVMLQMEKKSPWKSGVNHTPFTEVSLLHKLIRHCTSSFYLILFWQQCTYGATHTHTWWRDQILLNVRCSVWVWGQQMTGGAVRTFVSSKGTCIYLSQERRLSLKFDHLHTYTHTLFFQLLSEFYFCATYLCQQKLTIISWTLYVHIH